MHYGCDHCSCKQFYSAHLDCRFRVDKNPNSYREALQGKDMDMVGHWFERVMSQVYVRLAREGNKDLPFDGFKEQAIHMSHSVKSNRKVLDTKRHYSPRYGLRCCQNWRKHQRHSVVCWFSAWVSIRSLQMFLSRLHTHRSRSQLWKSVDHLSCSFWTR